MLLIRHRLRLLYCRILNLSLNENGLTGLNIDDVLESSFDLSGVASISLSTDSFDCSNIGENNVTVTVTDKIRK